MGAEVLGRPRAELSEHARQCLSLCSVVSQPSIPVLSSLNSYPAGSVCFSRLI